MSSGWIKLNRSICDWEWFDKNNHLKLFITLLTHANYKDKKWRNVLVKRGEFLTSLERLQSITGLTNGKIRVALRDMQASGEITIKTTNKYSIISITNWDKYQNDEICEQTNDKQTDKQMTTTKNIRNKEIKNKHMYDYEALYKLYPKKIGKKKGLQSCASQIKTQEKYEALKKAILNYAKHTQDRENRYKKDFSTFMNCWEDFVEVESVQASKPNKKLIISILSKGYQRLADVIEPLTEIDKSFVVDNGGLVNLSRMSEFQLNQVFSSYLP